MRQTLHRSSRRSTLCSIGVLAAVLFAASLLAAAPFARGDVFEPISLVSVSAAEQAGRADQPAISLNGRFVAFWANFGGFTGVWRRDLASSAIEPVAVGRIGTPAGRAELPSISADGRYVSFTTTAPLREASDTNASPDVYVRDMNVPCPPTGAGEDECSRPCPTETTCAFELVSAADKSDLGLSYQTGSALYGSVASARTAMSSDGRYVAFITTDVSDLVPAKPPAPPQTPQTPALQVAVRDREQHTTRLVSALYDPTIRGPAIDPETGANVPVPTAGTEARIFGAVYGSGGGGAPAFVSHDSIPFAGASISGDGSTVTWLAQQVVLQAPVMTGDERRVEYAEPLWRRIGDGPLAATRRVAGFSDPLNPACIASKKTEPVTPPSPEDPCQGPFLPGGDVASIEPASGSDYLPQLDFDGRTLTFVTSPPPIGGGEFGNTGTSSDDLYVVNMGAVQRIAAVRRLTAIAAGSLGAIGRVEPVQDLGISPDGEQIAFSSRRTVFPLASPQYISPPTSSSSTNEGSQELYDVDLKNDTLTRVTQGFAGDPTAQPQGSESANGAPSFGGEGCSAVAESCDLIAFASAATNLAFGDGNGASDAFLARRKRFVNEAGAQFISPAPFAPETRPAWLLGVRARSRSDASVVLEVATPGAGELSASAHSVVPTSARAVARGPRGRTRRGALARRAVATAAASVGREAIVAIRLVLPGRYRALAARRYGLQATVSVVLSSSGRAPVRAEIPATFILRHRRRHATRAAARGSVRR
jgi:WD40-like Beta Propeller Repeat